MKVVCDACQTVYHLADSKLTAEVAQAKCKVCGNRLIVRRAEPTVDEPSVYEPTVESPPSRREEPSIPPEVAADNAALLGSLLSPRVVERTAPAPEPPAWLADDDRPAPHARPAPVDPTPVEDPMPPPAPPPASEARPRPRSAPASLPVEVAGEAVPAAVPSGVIPESAPPFEEEPIDPVAISVAIASGIAAGAILASGAWTQSTTAWIGLGAALFAATSSALSLLSRRVGGIAWLSILGASIVAACGTLLIAHLLQPDPGPTRRPHRPTPAARPGLGVDGGAQSEETAWSR